MRLRKLLPEAIRMDNVKSIEDEVLDRLIQKLRADSQVPLSCSGQAGGFVGPD
jgi:hypothetical protein